MWRSVSLWPAKMPHGQGLGHLAERLRRLCISPTWVDVRWGLMVFALSLVGILEVGIIVAATGGLPNVYVNLYYLVLAVAAFSLPLPLAVLLALVAGLVPSHQGFLNMQAIIEGGEGLVRPMTFLVISAAISILSSILRQRLEEEKGLRMRLEEEAREREKARRMAEESEQQLRLLLDHVQDMVIFVDPQGIIVDVNSAVEEQCGWERQELVGKSVRGFVPPASWRWATQELTHQALTHGRCKVETQFLTRDGQWRMVEATIVPVHRHGQLVGWVITAHDITPRRQAEAERDRALLRLLAAQDEERRRVGYDFHDGPLQHMSTALSLLEVHARRHRQRDHHLEQALRSLRQAVQDARHIITHLSPRELEEGGLPQALASLLEHVRQRWGIETELVVEGEGWGMEHPREAALLRIAQEAINNAVKHSGSPRIRVQLWQEGRSVHLSVRDWGRGIQREGPETDPSQHLGMLSMQERAHLLGGHLEIHSAPHWGTEVRVSVPLRHAQERSGP